MLNSNTVPSGVTQIAEMLNQGLLISKMQVIRLAFFLHVIISGKEIMFSAEFVCLPVSNIPQKSYEQIAMKVYGGVRGDKRNKW